MEDHGDVLEHLYDAIGVRSHRPTQPEHPPTDQSIHPQAKRVPFRGLRWVHLDSHPDLTLPPNLRPATVTDPPALYAALECVWIQT